MKFTDGYWHMRSDVTAYFPATVHEVDLEGDSLLVYGPVKPIEHRGDTLNLPML